MHPTHDFGGRMIHIFRFLFLASFDSVGKIWGGSTGAGAVMMVARRMGWDGKLGASTLLVRAALQCKCGCYRPSHIMVHYPSRTHGLLC